MSLNRYDAKRDQNEPEIVSTLRSVGAAVWLLSRPCDLLVGFRGRFVTMEVKKPGPPSAQRLTLLEDIYAATCASMGLPHYIVSSIAEALAAIGAVEAEG